MPASEDVTDQAATGEGSFGPIVVLVSRSRDAVAKHLMADDCVRWRRTGPAGGDSALDEIFGEAPEAKVAVAGVGDAAGAAVNAAADHGRVAALLVIGPQLEAATVDLIRNWPEVPLLALAEPEDRAGLAGAVDAFLASSHAASDLWVGPLDDSLDAATAWVSDRLTETAEISEVTVRSSDGWHLRGTMRLPLHRESSPGVVLLHSGRSDRAAFAGLERLLADDGLAVLNLDWRGRGQSTNLGSYFDLVSETKSAAWRDALAALDHLARQPVVAEDRLGVVGVVHGAEYAVRAAHRDRRVKALVVLTGYRPAEEEEAELLRSGEVEVLYVTCTGHTITTRAMRELYETGAGRRSELVEYPGAAIGYQLFELDASLEPRITRWLQEVLEA